MLQEDHGVLRAGSGFHQSLGIFCATGKYNAPAGDVREEAFNAGGMPRAALNIAADRHADNTGHD